MTAITDSSSLEALGLRTNDQLKALEKEDKDEMGMDTFLNLMTAQMQNQDPLNPQDSNEFLSQMAQFTAVEGMVTLNENFDALANSLTSSQALQAGGLVGRSVLTEGNQAYFSPDTGLEGELQLDSSTQNLQVRLFDSAGGLVKSLDLGTQPEGPLTFSWDGSLDAGGQAPEGIYRIEADYLDGDGRTPVSTLVPSRVESVVVGKNNEELVLNLTGMGSVPFSSVSRIQ
ncbi:flagellar hook assembly protein FlgD [Magnetovirga frankeli]|uniref:flagellar hook assembly protein FlgD n=1 Tax=Magnetovirga frankeli TaxID=947516 RepID=UPI001293F0CC|nr:flagellar hook assembly protein FlgD [gamma proteobacterium SS-5]